LDFLFLLEFLFSKLFLIFSFFLDEAIERFKSWIKSRSSATGVAPSTADQLEELRNLQTMSSLVPSFRCIIFLGAMFTDHTIASNEVKKYHDVLKGLAPTEIQQRHLLAAFEWFCGSKYPQPLLKAFAKVLMQLYDEEIIEEDVFLAWGGDTTRNEFTFEESMISFETLESLHNYALPFIKWLQEAEEEGEEGEDDEEEGDEEEEDA
jgi:translation initiation factor 5